MKLYFDYGPTPTVLHGLSGGQLASRWQRAVRLWWLLRSLYGRQAHWQASLPDPFRYGDVRARLFAPSHGTAEQAAAVALAAGCGGSGCICQRSLRGLLSDAAPDLDWLQWQAGMVQYSGIPPEVWPSAGDAAPFAVVHRSIRDDLKALAQQGWLVAVGRGQFRCVPPSDWPPLPDLQPGADPDAIFPAPITREMLSTLEAIAFVQPNLELLLNSLWEQIAQPTGQPIAGQRWWETEPERRIFIHLDYILPPAAQEQVDTHQAIIEQLWRTGQGGVMQFNYWLAHHEQAVTVTVYPVCLHYARRAKYLSAYGLDPSGQLGWHNYRLDRILSDPLKLLPWGDPAVPQALRDQRDRGELPTPALVEAALAEAWGFNFYQPKAWLLLRFPLNFARWYVAHTVRHPTFEAVAYSALPGLIARHVPEAEQAQVRAIVAGRSPQDAYYAAWVRLGDINTVMRLRDWRPNGEVLAPLPLRQQMALEVQQEAEHYRCP